MELTLEQIRLNFSSNDYNRGNQYYHQGRVRDLYAERLSSDFVQVACQVQGSELYDVDFWIMPRQRLRLYCDCPRFNDVGRCKHIAAAMIAYVEDYQTPPDTDPAAQELLSHYIARGNRTPLDETPARLIPKLLNRSSFYQGYPSVNFRVGQKKLYAVRNVEEFLRNVAEGATVPLGKNVSLNHNIRQFDQRSQTLIRIMMNSFPQFRSTESYYVSYGFWRNSSRKNELKITGDDFDRFFDLFEEQPLEGETGSLTLLRQDPAVTLSLQSTENGAEFTIQLGEPLTFFGNSGQLYALGESALYRCSPEFRERVKPLLELDGNRMRIGFSNLPTFCSCVLPEIQNYVNLDDPEALLEAYLPEECTPCFYLDMDDDILRLEVKFRYGERVCAADKELDETVRRDTRREQQVLACIRHSFTAESNGFSLAGDDVIYDFLTTGLEALRELGEVFISDRLRRKQVSPSRTGVGVSVSDGMLTLSLDTGEFPLEELDALYQSLLKKKKYHRLADGRFLTLDGSGCETLAEMAHMLQLSPRELQQGELKVPAFRALYLDSVLSQSEDLHVTRDRQFRSMIRNFKSLSESDYTLPGSLEGVLRPYQKFGFQWLKTLESCGFGGILADEMGLGKTLQIIAYLASLSAEQREHPSLVVCPASLILNWGEEFQKFAPELKISLIYGTAQERQSRIQDVVRADVWVTSYELLRQDILLYQETIFYACILDEGQHVKNQSTLVSKAVKAITCRQRFVLTGTPIENRLSELWNLFDFLMPGYLYSHRGFVEKLEKPIIKSKNAEAMLQLRKLVQPFLLRRMKQDVLRELPPKIEHIRRIPMGQTERMTYLSAVEAAKNSFGDAGKMKILAALTQLRQICCAPGLCFENYNGETSKLEACLELCSGMVENGHQILLFSQFTSMLDILHERLTQRGISTFTLQGSTPKEQRARLVKSFNAGGASVFLISLKAGGTGLNLTAADVVIHYDPWWNLAAQNQATDRAHRMGQRQCVQVYKLIMKDTIEERILELQCKKSELLDVISGEGSPLELTQENLLALLD